MSVMSMMLVVVVISLILLVVDGFRLPSMPIRYFRRMQTLEPTENEVPVLPSPRSAFPPRNDIGRMLITGIIGVDPKETYLSNGHYVINLSLGVSGHFKSAHDWEKSKPNEVMWVSTEIWDDEAKNNFNSLKKGATLCGSGVLLHNKWIDKQSGEERKQFKLRLLKVMNKNKMEELVDTIDKLDSE